MNSKQKNGEYIKYEDDGTIVAIDWYTKGNHDCSLSVEDGEHIYQHTNGSVWQKYNIVDGKVDGEWILNHASGVSSLYREFKMGLKVGTWTGWHDDGT